MAQTEINNNISAAKKPMFIENEKPQSAILRKIYHVSPVSPKINPKKKLFADFSEHKEISENILGLKSVNLLAEKL